MPRPIKWPVNSSPERRKATTRIPYGKANPFRISGRRSPKVQEQKNVLYSFVEDGEIRYVGKSIRTLRQRMYGYWRPSSTQSTNVRINGLISESLVAGHDVEILVLPDNGLMHYGQFHLNLAAGLEDSIIAAIMPPCRVSDATSTTATVCHRSTS